MPPAGPGRGGRSPGMIFFERMGRFVAGSCEKMLGQSAAHGLSPCGQRGLRRRLWQPRLFAVKKGYSHRISLQGSTPRRQFHGRKSDGSPPFSPESLRIRERFGGACGSPDFFTASGALLLWYGWFAKCLGLALSEDRRWSSGMLGWETFGPWPSEHGRFQRGSGNGWFRGALSPPGG